jgi:hypothetical protein
MERTTIRICYCGLPNTKHVGGVTYSITVDSSRKIYPPHWYSRAGSGKFPEPFLRGQSHGGHEWIPDSD